MTQTILVPTTGSATDDSVLATAAALAAPLKAHLDFVHLRLSAMEAMVRDPHADYCMGAAISTTLAHLEAEEESLAENARHHVTSFCESHGIALSPGGGLGKAVSASYTQLTEEPRTWLMSRARLSDLVVLGRPNQIDYLPRELAEDLIMGSGRPVVLAPSLPSARSTGTVMLGWTECAASARALATSLPLLKSARRVIVVRVSDKPLGRQSNEIGQYLRWHGIEAELQVVAGSRWNAAERLATAARHHRADLLVIGGFSRGRARESWFGGVTQSFVDDCALPILIMH